jgi:hypothetical protein
LVSVVLKNNNYTSKALHTLVFGEGIVNGIQTFSETPNC